MDINAFNVTVTPIIAIIIGLILAFAGYRLKRIAMAIIWFVIGYSFVGQIAPNLIEDPFWQMILRIAAGAILSMIGLSIEKLAVSLTTGIVVYYSAFRTSYELGLAVRRHRNWRRCWHYCRLGYEASRNRLHGHRGCKPSCH